jgi:hypothetical protein
MEGIYYPQRLTESQIKSVDDAFKAWNSVERVTPKIDLTKRRKRSLK